ncbi:phospholipase D3 [Drosophila pseudoobscura]|uniref:Phospholipase D3 n=1 Tax=Drosophila pseudoobscura pseudoobscura TaxID=46245 RepID=Q29NS7_DROPS|nr:phospholipase D3 [Drosophila pseudoobscura]
MPQQYKPLHNEEDVENAAATAAVTTGDNRQQQQEAANPPAVQLLMVSLFMLLFFGSSFFQPRPRLQHLKGSGNKYDSTKYGCNIQLVESIPIGLNYSEGSPRFLSTFEAWQQLLDSAKESLDIASFYWTMRAQDTPGVNDSSTQPGDEIFRRFLANGNGGGKTPRLNIRIAQSEPSSVSPNEDTKLLASNGAAEVVTLSFPKYFGGGVLHTKLWIVDEQHFYLGSANMDWRALTQVKEMGILAQNCPQLTRDVALIFKAYWCLGKSTDAKIPYWGPDYFTKYNLQSPMILNVNQNTTMEGFLSSSPPPLSAQSRTGDLEAILSTIDSAITYVNIAVMDYYPLIIYGQHPKYWPYIDDALRRAAVERGVSVKLLISWWKHSNPSENKYLKSLQDLSSKKDKIDIQIRRFIVPTDADQEKIPYGRVNHNKYMVTDRVAYIGTSNWSGDYFTDTAGIGLVLRETHETEHTQTLRSDLRNVFERDWNSPYAHELE